MTLIVHGKKRGRIEETSGNQDQSKKERSERKLKKFTAEMCPLQLSQSSLTSTPYNNFNTLKDQIRINKKGK